MRQQQLIKSYDVFEYELVTEATLPLAPIDRSNPVVDQPKKKIIMKGILQKADTLNQNGRIYPRAILEREVRNYQKFIFENRAMGELDHPSDSVVSLKNVSHIVREATLSSDGTVTGVVEVLNTPSGLILQSLIESGVKLGISSRGVGSTARQGDYQVVQDDFQLICWDMVSEPSTPQAFMIPEGRQYPVTPKDLKVIFSKSDRINRIINELIM
jgi:hypothetical protein